MRPWLLRLDLPLVDAAAQVGLLRVDERRRGRHRDRLLDRCHPQLELNGDELPDPQLHVLLHDGREARQLRRCREVAETQAGAEVEGARHIGDRHRYGAGLDVQGLRFTYTFPDGAPPGTTVQPNVTMSLRDQLREAKRPKAADA